MNLKRRLTAVLAAALLSGPLMADSVTRTPAAESAHVYIISPQDGDEVSGTFRVRFGLSGMGVAPAGIDAANTGHHHLLIDMTELPDMNRPLDDRVQHFGGGQTEVDLTLPPGEHTLQLLLGDLRHVPHDPPLLSEKIRITVK